MSKILVAVDTHPYNPRRYGRPWIAKVELDGSRLSYSEWGTWIGSNGSDGRLELSVEPGTVIAHGQRDTRNSTGTTNDLGVVQQDGTISPLRSKIEAVDYLRKHGQTAENSTPEVLYKGSNLLSAGADAKLIVEALNAIFEVHGHDRKWTVGSDKKLVARISW